MNPKELGIKTSKDPMHKEFLKECYLYSKLSKHPSTHNAALLVKDDKIILKGVNNFPPGVKKTPNRIDGDNKHIYPNHAERDVIYKAAKEGIKTKNLFMVMPWLPCIPCANAIISSGIKTLIVHKQMLERTREGWIEELKNAVQILKEAKVELIAYEGTIGAKAFMHANEWDA